MGRDTTVNDDNELTADQSEAKASGYRNAAHLRQLADRCERGAQQLTYEGDHAAEVLADRGHPDADPNEWAQRKQAAATAARQYAADLRAEADALGQGERPSQERIDQAEKVASAAELGGILIDGRRMAEATATADNAHIWNPADKEAWEAGTHPAQTKAAVVEGSGMFEHVAEEGQVPFWQLRGATDQATNEQSAPAQAVRVDDDADEA
jgi:hypothetical protein